MVGALLIGRMMRVLFLSIEAKFHFFPLNQPTGPQGEPLKLLKTFNFVEIL